MIRVEFDLTFYLLSTKVLPFIPSLHNYTAKRLRLRVLHLSLLLRSPLREVAMKLPPCSPLFLFTRLLALDKEGPIQAGLYRPLRRLPGYVLYVLPMHVTTDAHAPDRTRTSIWCPAPGGWAATYFAEAGGKEGAGED